jgi:hypothetical protein
MCVTYNGTSDANDPVIYRNGASIAITEVINPIGARVDDAGDSLRIGDVANGNRAFSGLIDEVRIYNRALGATEIAALAKSGAVKFTTSSVALQSGSTLGNGLVGHWTFDGSDITTTVTDRSGQNNHGYFNGGATSSAKVIGKLGQAIALDATDDTITVPHGNGSLNIASADRFTGAFWIKKASVGGSADDVFYKGPNSYGIGTKADGSVYQPEMWIGGSFQNGCTDCNLQSNQWHHVVGVFDGPSNQITWYANGVQKGDNAGAESQSIPSDTGDFIIGEAIDTEECDCMLDDLRVYNRALTPAEVKQLYNLGQTTLRP